MTWSLLENEFFIPTKKGVFTFPTAVGGLSFTHCSHSDSRTSTAHRLVRLMLNIETIAQCEKTRVIVIFSYNEVERQESGIQCNFFLSAYMIVFHVLKCLPFLYDICYLD